MDCLFCGRQEMKRPMWVDIREGAVFIEQYWPDLSIASVNPDGVRQAGFQEKFKSDHLLVLEKIIILLVLLDVCAKILCDHAPMLMMLSLP